MKSQLLKCLPQQLCKSKFVQIVPPGPSILISIPLLEHMTKEAGLGLTALTKPKKILKHAMQYDATVPTYFQTHIHTRRKISGIVICP